jgi:hypothetical protein
MIGSNRPSEDIHFHIDNVTPLEICNVLRVLSLETAMTPNEISDMLVRDYAFTMQSDHTYSPRRLYDIGLTQQERKGQKVSYRLTLRGQKLQNIHAMNPSLSIDLLHYLHYTGYTGQPLDRKNLWSYRRCCEHLWSEKRFILNKDLAGIIISEIDETFPNLESGHARKSGMRFSSKAVDALYSWIRALEPPLFTKTSKDLQPRQSNRYELALLALTDTYRSRGYRYGDAVLMDESLINQTAGVFFLEPNCCVDLLRLAAKIVPLIKISDTLGGASINLFRPFTLDDL